MNTRQRVADSPPQTKLLLSIAEAATVLSLGRTAVYELVMRQEIVSIKVGRTRRVPLYALHRFIRTLAAQQEGE